MCLQDMQEINLIMKRKEQKIYYKLTFSMGTITEDESTYVREAMEKLEQEAPIMKCFQNVHGNVLGSSGRIINDIFPDFVIYYRGEDVDCINRFLFKMQLKFSDFVVHTTHTLQEYYS